MDKKLLNVIGTVVAFVAGFLIAALAGVQINAPGVIRCPKDYLDAKTACIKAPHVEIIGSQIDLKFPPNTDYPFEVIPKVELNMIASKSAFRWFNGTNFGIIEMKLERGEYYIMRTTSDSDGNIVTMLPVATTGDGK